MHKFIDFLYHLYALLTCILRLLNLHHRPIIIGWWYKSIDQSEGMSQLNVQAWQSWFLNSVNISKHFHCNLRSHCLALIILLPLLLLLLLLLLPFLLLHSLPPPITFLRLAPKNCSKPEKDFTFTPRPWLHKGLSASLQSFLFLPWSLFLSNPFLWIKKFFLHR